jgi:hypothetical protein
LDLPFNSFDLFGKREVVVNIFPLGILFGCIALKGVYPFGEDLINAINKMKRRGPLVIIDVKPTDLSVQGDKRFFAALLIIS